MTRDEAIRDFGQTVLAHVEAAMTPEQKQDPETYERLFRQASEAFGWTSIDELAAGMMAGVIEAAA